MRQKFECKNCKRTFETDLIDMVVCPHCHSDNVEPVSHHIPAPSWKTMSFYAAVLVVCSVFFLSTRNCRNGCDVSTDDLPSPTISVNQPVLNEDGMYSIDVKGNNLPQGIKCCYVLMSHFEKKVIKKSKDGHFHEIPYCEDDSHSYDFAIMDSKTDTLLCIPVEQTGFIKQNPVDDKMTIEQLQCLIAKRDDSLNGAGRNDYLSPDYKLLFTGLSPDSRKPESWTEVFEMLDYEIWKDITIYDIEYDKKNRISVIKMNVETSR